MSNLAVHVQNVSKKLCRRLKSAMLYAGVDICKESLGLPVHSHQLRPSEFWAVQDVTFQLRRGECLGLIGSNGAGKSTLLKLLNGILRPDVGSIALYGRVGALIEVGAGFHPLLTGRENIYVNGAILGMLSREIDHKLDSIVEFSGLSEEVLDSPVKTYSSGMYVRLGFSVAVHSSPDILLIDEVLAVGDMQFQAQCLNALGRMRNEGTTIILVSHAMNHIAGWADRVLALDYGRVFAVGEPLGVIQEYADYVDRNKANAVEAPRPQIGSGRARIQRISVLGAAGTPSSHLRVGEPMTVVLDLQIAEAVRGAEIDLKLYDGFDRLLVGASSRYCLGSLDLPAGQCRVKARFPPLPVNGGLIRTSVALWAGARAEKLDWIKGEPMPVRGGVAASEGQLAWFPEYHVEAASDGDHR